MISGVTVAEETEHRRERRQRVLKRATIVLCLEKSEITCTIRNQNSGGAELMVPLEAVVPTEFLVYVPVDGIAYRAVIRWRRKDRIGVQFTGTEPKPPFHYG